MRTVAGMQTRSGPAWGVYRLVASGMARERIARFGGVRSTPIAGGLRSPNSRREAAESGLVHSSIYDHTPLSHLLGDVKCTVRFSHSLRERLRPHGIYPRKGIVLFLMVNDRLHSRRRCATALS